MKVKKRWVILMTAMTFFDCLRGRKPSAMGAAVGCVVGLVAITPSAGYVTVGQSIFIAFVITLICNIAVYWRSHSNIDDALDFSQHDEHYGLAHIGERELAEYEEHICEKNHTV